MEAHRTHDPKVVGSNPTSALDRKNMNLINSIKTGQDSGKFYVLAKDTKENRRILHLLVSKRLIRGFVRYESVNLKILLKYVKGSKITLSPTVVSKPSRRIYCSVSESTPSYVINSSNGMSYGYHRVGGEVLFSLQ